MNFANYADFRTSVLRLIDGDEVAQTFGTTTLDLLIGLGESRVYNGDAMTPGLRASTMLTPLSVGVASNLAALPANLIELAEVRFGTDTVELIPLDRLRAFANSGGVAQFAAQDGDSLTFWPAASGTVLGKYYARPPMMKDDWNAQTTVARYPELFLFACLYECALFVGEDGANWEKRYRELAMSANNAERWRVYSGSPLRVRAR